MDDHEPPELPGFDFMGYSITCDSCGHTEHLPCADTLYQALTDAQDKGFTIIDDQHYCWNCVTVTIVDPPFPERK